MKSNERLIAALNKAIKIKPDIEIGKYIRYMASVSDLAYMSDDDIARQIEQNNKMAEKYSIERYFTFKATDINYSDKSKFGNYPEEKLHDFTKENEEIAYERYKEKMKGRVIFDLNEKLDMSDFLRRFTLSYVEADEYKGITVLNHKNGFLDSFPMEYRHMNGYMVARKGDKYIAKHVYLVKIPCFGELMEYVMHYCKREYDECLVIALDWCESPRFTDYTNHIMYGLSYNRDEEIVEIFNEHQTIEIFHEFMQKANKIISEWKGVLYDDGTWKEET